MKCSHGVALFLALTALAVFAGSTQPAIAKDQVGERSCDALDACLSNEGRIGKRSCNAEGACEANAGRIGNQACNAAAGCTAQTGRIKNQACNESGACRSQEGRIERASCNDEDACIAQSGRIRKSACNRGAACQFQEGRISTRSCNGEAACFFQSGKVSKGSCNAGNACDNQSGRIGKNSCNREFSCVEQGGSIARNSCNAEGACQDNIGAIGKNSCNGSNACQGNTQDIEDNQCNEDGACSVPEAVPNSVEVSFTFGNIKRTWDLDPSKEGNTCDTLANLGSSWPLEINGTFVFASTNAAARLEFFTSDYCTGNRAGNFLFQPGSWDGKSLGGAAIKSMRPRIQQNSEPGLPGVGLKVVFFPGENLDWYDEITCRENPQPNLGLKDPNNAQKGNWPNQCASADDRIFCLSPTDKNFTTRYGTQGSETTSAKNWLIGPPPGNLDFAGEGGPGTIAYSFGAYPLGSIFYNLYGSTWNGDGSGAYCTGNSVNGAGQPYQVCADTYYKDYCVAIRFWEDDTTNCDSVDWNAAGYRQTFTRVQNLCDGGTFPGACYNSGSDGARQQGSISIACENGQIQDANRNAYNNWPMKAKCMYTRIMPCADL
ncbi:MAG: hypothetical protein VX546_09030 [Myxococcota bacterium]|nr:hypothetical protein [Myxococcota bacterium]